MMQAAARCPCKDSVLGDLTQPTDLTRTLSLLQRPPDTLISKLKAGYISLKTPFDVKKANDIDGRLANITSSIALLHASREFLIRVQALQDSVSSVAVNTVLRCMDGLEASMTQTSALLKKLSKNVADRRDYFVDNYDLLTPSPLSAGTSTSMDFVTSYKFRIVPDFGFIGVFKGSKVGFQDMTPYLGFNINFRSIDKSIPMRNVLYKSWLHYLSFIGGITLRSLKIDGKRDNFFGDNDLLTGLGFRLNNAIKLTGGVVWFRRIDTNPLSTNKPLGCSGFAGISIDLELQSLFGGIANLFK
jgi:hypothetical protein